MFDVSTAFRDLMEIKPAGGSSKFSPPPPQTPPWEDGGYHFEFYQDHPYSLFYGEYWYFNFTDHQSGTSGMIAFGAFNPRDFLGQGRFAVTASLFQPGVETYTRMDSYPIAEFSASEEKPTSACATRSWC